MTMGALRDRDVGDQPDQRRLRLRRLVVRLWALVLAVAWGGLSLHPDYGSDAFFHWMLGREVLRTHARVVAERWALPGLRAQCAVPEWLWDVVASLVQSAYGAAGTAALVVAVAGLAAWVCVRLVAARAREEAVIVLVTACVSPVVLARIQDRPESVVLIIVPLLVLVAERLATSVSRRSRVVCAVSLVALVLFWAQVHPSFILAPILVAIIAGDRLVQVDRGLSAALAVALLAVSFTTAQGGAVYAYAWQHASSYTVAHVSEWEPPTWDMLDPSRSIHLPLYAALWIAALVGIGRSRRVPYREAALALFGLFLVTRGRRNLGIGGELLVPFASEGLDALFSGISVRSGRAALLASLAFSAVVFVRLAAVLDIEVGPLGTIDSADALFPIRAAAFLAKAPAGTRVMTTYEAGAPLAFWLDGHVRTSLDARTLLYFDDPEYAAARASWEDGGALDKALRMDAFDAAVVDRNNPVCALFAARTDWGPAVVEATYTTFVRLGTHPASGTGHLAPCGEGRFTADACDGGGEVLLRELDGLAGDPFIDELRVEARIECSKGGLDGDALVAILPPRSKSAGFLSERDGSLAWILAHAGRLDPAIALVRPYVATGDVRAVSRVAWVLDERGDSRLAPMLRQVVKLHDDASPPWVFALLANACARQGDFDCAATYGVFAAAKGEGEASPALCAVAAHHSDPVIRSDAERWLEALRFDEAAGGKVASPPCP